MRDWMVLYMRNSAPARPRCWIPTRNSALSRWYAAIRRRGKRVGPCDWWPKKPSSGDWRRASEERPCASCCCTTTSGRGGKKMWWCADLTDEYIEKMEDGLEIYE